VCAVSVPVPSQQVVQKVEKEFHDQGYTVFLLHAAARSNLKRGTARH